MKYLTLIFTALLVTACSPNSNEMVEFPDTLLDDVPIINNGETVLLSTPLGWNTFETTRPVGVFIQNMTGESLVFEYDYGVQVFSLKDGKWNKVGNSAVYSNEEEIILQAGDGGDISSTGIVVVHPEIDINEVYILRIFIVGAFFKDRSDRFSTYVDIKLEP